jgi:aminoglycoside 3-N-acetyltransferase
MLHSAFGRHHGFNGSIEQLTDVFIDALGARGHLLMVSLPYRSSTLEYLRRLRVFDVRRTPSMMGLVSEYFRRRPGVQRSLHPTHPVLVHGPDADWYVAGHERALHPCGPGTPFEKLAERDGMVAFFNVPFATFTFFHHLEHLVSPHLPFALYTDELFEVPVIDMRGEPGVVKTHAFTREAIKRRRFEILERALRARGAIATVKVGNTRMEAIRVREAIACAHEMQARGRLFYDFDVALPKADTT